MRCNKCKTENEKGAKFCSSCGSILEINEIAFTPKAHPKWELKPISMFSDKDLNLNFEEGSVWEGNLSFDFSDDIGGGCVFVVFLFVMSGFMALLGAKALSDLFDIDISWTGFFIMFFISPILFYLFIYLLIALFRTPSYIMTYIMNKNQKKVFFSKVDYVGKSISHYMVIAKKGKLGLYDKEEKTIVLNLEYDDFYEEAYLIFVKKNNKLGLFDSYNNRIILYPKYDNFYKESELIVVENNGKFGCLNLQIDKMIIPIQFDEKPSIISPGVIETHSSGQVFYFDKFGKQLS